MIIKKGDITVNRLEKLMILLGFVLILASLLVQYSYLSFTNPIIHFMIFTSYTYIFYEVIMKLYLCYWKEKRMKQMINKEERKIVKP